MAQRCKLLGYWRCLWSQPCLCSMWCCPLVRNLQMECSNNQPRGHKDSMSHTHRFRKGEFRHNPPSQFCTGRRPQIHLYNYTSWFQGDLRKSLDLDLHLTAPKRRSSCHPLPLGASIGSCPCCHTPGRKFLGFVARTSGLNLAQPAC